MLLGGEEFVRAKARATAKYRGLSTALRFGRDDVLDLLVRFDASVDNVLFTGFEWRALPS
jgi:hypothetical protein